MAVPTVDVADNLQEVALNEPHSEVGVHVQETLPVGVIGVPGEVSLTVAVHDAVLWSTNLLVIVQLTLVEVARWVTIRPVEPELF